MTAWTVCDNCSNPVALFSRGWYRCRMCGHESLRESSSYGHSVHAHQLSRASFIADSESDGRAAGAPALGLSP